MNVTYRLRRRDIFFASVQGLFHQPWFVVFLVITLAWISYQNWQAISPTRTLLVRTITFIVMELIPILVMAAVMGLFLVLTALSQSNKTLLTEQTITLDESFLGCHSEYGRSEMKWKAVQRIVRTRSYLFLYVSQVGAMLIPRRAFSSKEHWDKFVGFCREKSRTS